MRKQATVLEWRSTGGHTLVEPSVHPDGDRYVRHERGRPARITLAHLRSAVIHTAIAALAARYWPAPGGRQISKRTGAGQAYDGSIPER